MTTTTWALASDTNIMQFRKNNDDGNKENIQQNENRQGSMEENGHSPVKGSAVSPTYGSQLPPSSSHRYSWDYLFQRDHVLEAIAKPNETSADYISIRYMIPRLLVKDDVFLAQPAISELYPVLSNHVSDNQSQASAEVPTPCLSPVTSPSDFLCDHEPLFDGIEDLNEPLSVPLDNSPIEIRQQCELSNDVDWNKLLHDFHEEEDHGIPTPAPTTTSESEDFEDLFEKEDDEEGEEAMQEREPKYEDAAYHEDEDDSSDSEFLPLAFSRKRPLLTDKISYPFDRQQNKRYRKKQKHTNSSSSSSSKITRPSTTTTTYLDNQNQNMTVFEYLTQSGVDWCRYCGTTEGVNWRPGPWGKRTLCNKHGCDYKGYGLASRLPRLDLSEYAEEPLEERRRPIVQQFCVACQEPESSIDNPLIPCDGGCSRAYHHHCLSEEYIPSSQPWCCSSLCRDNRMRNKVVVDLPRKHIPLMRPPRIMGHKAEKDDDDT
ncbi:uncharacterized protein BYT42DRAFT_568655 [Radiomyces spectabilis]|uniref:uncharacterized protein n=1 Tax=Radiomyces spectabilis TaxID=64574 RepID=UPI00221F43A9|nr:uncharacterized protein BYT42DRAFT_568655 [Radiomyces spectabilis]KAI8379396.1 hypothetical protein BYT42DRAFT_568655 [Radiomyces spectabilis]